MMSSELYAALERFTQYDRILVASDFDGVLAPLVQNPLDSRATAGTLEALQTLSSQHGVCTAVASGRDLATLRALTQLEGSGVVLIGSHGAESSENVSPGNASVELSETQQQSLREATAALTEIAARFGARVEHKPAGVVLHTRGLPDEPADAAAAQALALAQRPSIHAMRGKAVVELSVVNVSKGIALTALAQKCGVDATFYMGDDVTDETAFAVLPRSEGNVTVKVGAGDTAAAYRIDIADVVSVLNALVRLRTE